MEEGMGLWPNETNQRGFTLRVRLELLGYQSHCLLASLPADSGVLLQHSSLWVGHGRWKGGAVSVLGPAVGKARTWAPLLCGSQFSLCPCVGVGASLLGDSGLTSVPLFPLGFGVEAPP